MEKITIRRPDDFHVHFREDKMLKAVVEHTAQHFARALVMPNTLNPPILTGKDVKHYRSQIIEAVAGRFDFEPLMTIKITNNTMPQMIEEAHQAGAVAGKIYPVGVTTHSEDGVTDFRQLYPVFAEMNNLHMVLSLHGELPGKFCLDREKRFIYDVLYDIVERFPRLKIVLEHISTEEAVNFVKDSPPNVAATITVHHLLLTLDDVIGDKLRPHHFCKPVAKWPSDRKKLIEAATSGNPKFFLGTDSAPHPQTDKECSHCAAGIFSAPVALPLLVQIFEQQGALDRLESFTSTFGAAFYSLPLNEGSIELIKESWEVPAAYISLGGICFVPFMAGETLQWQLAPS